MRASLLDRHAGAVGVAGFLLSWELAARFIWQDPATLPAPTQALAEAWRFLTWPELARHVGVSLWRIAIGFAIAATLGMTLGLVCGWSRWLSWAVRPFVEVLRPIPPLAWIPIAIVWFGLGEPSKVFVIVLGAFFPIFTAAYRGVTMVPPVLFRAAETMDVHGLRLLWQVAAPAALPDIATGLRIGLGLSFGVLIAAELIAAESGLGQMIMEARQVGHLGVSIFGILLIGLLTMAADQQLGRFIARTVGRWAPV